MIQLPITFAVDGVAVAKGRPRVVRRRKKGGGQALVALTPAATVAWEERVRQVAWAAGIRPYPGPLVVTVTTYLPDLRAVDVDNLAKAVKDGLEGVAYANDRQVFKLVTEKDCDPDRPRVVIGLAHHPGWSYAKGKKPGEYVRVRPAPQDTRPVALTPVEDRR